MNKKFGSGMRKQFEKELSELVSKYCRTMKAGEIAESVIGYITCLSCCAASRYKELDFIEDDLIKIIIKNVNLSRDWLKPEASVTEVE